MRRSAPVLVLLLAAAVALRPGTAQPATGLGNGPYLQWVTPAGIDIAWTTDQPGLGWVQVRPADDDAAPASEIWESVPTRAHRITLDTLDPARRYRYHVGGDGYASPPAEFRTAPAGPAPYTFVAYGDSRSNPKIHAAIAERILALSPAFVLHTGDLVHEDADEPAWTDQFFAPAAALLRAVPCYPSLGNHERRGSVFERLFALPGGRRYYSFDYAACHFVALDANFQYLKDRTQMRWLERDLATTAAVHRIAFFHQPPYGSSAKSGRSLESALVRDAFSSLLKKYGVRLVFTGHHHNYQHATVDGVHYVITAGGGAPLYEIGAPIPGQVKTDRSHHVVRVEVEGRTLRVEALRVDGTSIERFDVEAP